MGKHLHCLVGGSPPPTSLGGAFWWQPRAGFSFSAASTSTGEFSYSVVSTADPFTDITNRLCRFPTPTQEKRLSGNPPGLRHRLGLLGHPVLWTEELRSSHPLQCETVIVGLFRPCKPTQQIFFWHTFILLGLGGWSHRGVVLNLWIAIPPRAK